MDSVPPLAKELKKNLLLHLVWEDISLCMMIRYHEGRCYEEFNHSESLYIAHNS
jgi:hypothetical protein